MIAGTRTRAGRRPRAAFLPAVLVTVFCAVFGTALGVVTALPAAAQTGTGEQTDPDKAVPAAAGWLARQLVDGNHLETTVEGVGTFPNMGLTAEAVLAFDAAGLAQDFAAAATAWLASPEVLAVYVGDGATESYPGSLAKLAIVAMAQGSDPADFGGVDLLERLRARQDPATGRFSNLSQWGDATNGITQSLAIIALVRAGAAAEVAKPADFLLANQCEDGGFALDFGTPGCTGDEDTTAFAVQALLAAGRDADAPLDFLVGEQDAGGGFGGSGPTSEVNANSTGLAAQALRVGGRTAAADAAVAYLRGQQVGCTGPAEQRGAIAYKADGFVQEDAEGATPQALFGLTGTGLAEIDAGGDTTGAPTLDCAAPTTSPSPTTSAPPSSSTPPAHGTGTGAGDLPATGTRPWPTAGLGVLLVLAGTGMLLLSRRRRAATASRP